MITIEYSCTIKRGGNITITQYHYISHMTLKACIYDLDEIMRVYGDTLVNIRCTIFPNNKINNAY